MGAECRSTRFQTSLPVPFVPAPMRASLQRGCQMRMIAESHTNANLARLEGVRPKYTVFAELRLCETHFWVLKAIHSLAKDRTLDDEHSLAVLEALALAKDTRSAFETYLNQRWRPLGSQAGAERVPTAPWRDETLVLEQGKLTFVGANGILDLNAQSNAGASVLVGLLARERRRPASTERNVET